MTYVFSVVLIVGNSISSLLKGKNSIIKNLLLILMWVLFWGNYDNADYLNYKLLYDYISQKGKGFMTSEIGFTVIMKGASMLGLEYYQFLMILSFLGLYFVTSTINRYTSKPQLVYLLYFIHPFLLDIVQIRHFFAMSIIIYCLRFLEKDGITNNIKFVLGILVAFTIHYISIIFLPLLLIKKIKMKQLYIAVFITLIVGIPLAYTDIFQTIASYIVPIPKIKFYFINRAGFGFFIQFFIQGVILLMVYYSRVFLKKHESSNTFAELIYKINVYLLILFPLYIVNGTFERAFRMIMIPNYILFSLVFIKISNKEKIMVLLFLIIFVIALFIFYIFLNYRYTVFFPIFEKNLLLN